jgi:hypothetical protein
LHRPRATHRTCDLTLLGPIDAKRGVVQGIAKRSCCAQKHARPLRASASPYARPAPLPSARGNACAPTQPPLPPRRDSRRRGDQHHLHRERVEYEGDGRDERIEPATHTHICDATTGRSERSRDRWRFVKVLGGKRTFFEQQVQHRVDGGRRPKSRPLSSALRGIEALLAVVEVGALLHSVISPTLETGLRTQHRPGEARSRWDGQKASSCEQPVGVARAGDSAPLVDRSGRSEALSSAHHAQ